MKDNEIEVIAAYPCSTSARVRLPDGRTTGDIKKCWVKWGVFRCVFSDSEEFAVDMGDTELSEFKRPNDLAVYGVNEDDEADYDHDLSEELGVAL
jgi:hypothetical protein